MEKKTNAAQARTVAALRDEEATHRSIPTADFNGIPTREPEQRNIQPFSARSKTPTPGGNL